MVVLASLLGGQQIVVIKKKAGGGGSPAAFSDNFDRANSTSIGAAWTEAAGDFEIFTNTLRAISGSYANNFAIYSGTPCNTVQQYVKVTITNDGGDYPGIIVRYTNSSSPFYVLYHDQNALWDWSYKPSVAGSGTTIATVDTGTFVDGDTYGITVAGTGTSTVIRIWKNPTANTPVSATEWDSGDTTPEGTLTTDPPSPVDTGAYVGLAASASSASVIRFDNFFGGDAP